MIRPEGPWKLSPGFSLGGLIQIVHGLKERLKRTISDRFGLLIANLVNRRDELSRGPSDLTATKHTHPG